VSAQHTPTVKWCRHCVKANHSDDECWSTRAILSAEPMSPLSDDCIYRRIAARWVTPENTVDRLEAEVACLTASVAKSSGLDLAYVAALRLTAELEEARKDAPRERAKSVNVQAFLKASTVEVFSDGPQQGELTGRMKSALELVELWRETADLFRRRYRQALEVIELVRGHPDFDQGGVMAEAMDAVLNHEEPKILATLESIANGRMPPADAAMAKETQHGRPE